MTTTPAYQQCTRLGRTTTIDHIGGGVPSLTFTEGNVSTRFETADDQRVIAVCYTGKRHMLSLDHEPFASMDEAAQWVDDRGWPVPSKYRTLPSVRGY